jgi:hypothetical protein
MRRKPLQPLCSHYFYRRRQRLDFMIENIPKST